MSAQYLVEGEEYTLHMEGDRMEDSSPMSNPDHIGWFDSLEEAQKAADRWVAENGPAQVIHQKHGIGSIVHHEATIYAPVPGTGNDGYDPDMDSIGGASDLTEDLKRRFEHARRSYYDFLDYEDDSYEEI